MIVGDSPEGEADPGVAKENGEARDHQPRHRGGEEVEFRDQNAVDFEGRVVDAEIEPMDLRAPQELSRSLDDVGEAKSCHEQRNRRLVDEGPQHRSLDRDPKHHHDREGRNQRQRERHPALDEADEGKRREEQHRPLREVQHARGLVDQHEADRDERIHHARQQAADQDLDEEGHVEVGHQTASSSWATPR